MDFMPSSTDYTVINSTLPFFLILATLKHMLKLLILAISVTQQSDHNKWILLKYPEASLYKGTHLLVRNDIQEEAPF